MFEDGGTEGSRPGCWGLVMGVTLWGRYGVTLDNPQGRACPAQDVVAISQKAKFQEDG